MNTYSSYKESGVEWTGSIPNRWSTKKIRYIFWERKEINNPIKSENLISLTLDKGVIPHSEKRSSGNKPKEDLSKYKLVYPGDIVLNSMNVIVGSVGLSKYFGVVSPVYYMLIPKNPEDDVRYFHHLFRCVIFQRSLIGLGNGILIRHSETSGKMNTIRMRIPMDKLNNQRIPLPPPQEQQQISNYLDHKTQQIDSLIEKTQQKIELLKKHRTSLINQVVTKGLNPDVEMKDSGVEWIGKIPSGWNLTKLKYESNLIVDGTHFTPTYTEEGIPFLRVTDIHSDTINLEKVKHISIEEHSELIKRCNPRKGDLLLSKNGTIGLTKVVDWEWEFSIFVSLCLIRFKDSFSQYLFSYFFQSDVVDQQLVESSKQSTVTNLHLDKIRELVLIKPSIKEQKQIVEHLDTETSKVDSTIEKETQRIELLKEYRQSLISDVVTGKVDVRDEVLV
jgi:type I restriction enzyme, S subunit